MGEYDAVWVFIISAIFVGFYIFIEARPKGSTFLNLSLCLGKLATIYLIMLLKAFEKQKTTKTTKH